MKKICSYSFIQVSRGLTPSHVASPKLHNYKTTTSN